MAYPNNKYHSNSSADSQQEDEEEPWISWFCNLKGHEMFCEVERSYIEDGFNLYGLRGTVPNFSDCIDLILDRIPPDDDESDDSENSQHPQGGGGSSHLTRAACTLYGLIHARFILTAHGLDAMYNKYTNREFGTCPLVQCENQPVLPTGLKDEVGHDTVKVYCPKCKCVYHPPNHHASNKYKNSSHLVDGASFGTTFPHLFLMTFSSLVPDPLTVESVYVPRVFGFRVHRTAFQNSRSKSISESTRTNSTFSHTTAWNQPGQDCKLPTAITNANGKSEETANVETHQVAEQKQAQPQNASLKQERIEDQKMPASVAVKMDVNSNEVIVLSDAGGSKKSGGKKGAKGNRKTQENGSSSSRTKRQKKC